MASSRYESVPMIVEYMRKVKPNTVLDLGVGFGKIGWLVREYLEAWNDRVLKNQWSINLIGIEIFEDYHKDGLQRLLYDDIIYEDILNIIEIFPIVNRIDLICAIDVIEHLTKDSAMCLLEEIKDIGNNILLSIPIGKRWLRKSYGQNPYEAHLSSWEIVELEDIGYKTIHHYKIPDGREMGIFCYEK